MAATYREGAGVRVAREQLGLSQAKLAEITGISQASLSSFELGKADLDSDKIELVRAVLSRNDEVKCLAKRKKRYRVHEYQEVKQDLCRLRLACRTSGNAEYLRLLGELAYSQSHPAQKGPTALSLFSGCGGFSTGFRWAGFKLLGFVEIEAGFRDIYKENFPLAEELGSDITKVTDPQIDEWLRRLGPVDVIIGGPPCQGFSLAGKRQSEDARNTLFEHYLRVVERVQPNVAILENVRLLMSMRFPDGTRVPDAIRKGFSIRGYNVLSFEVNAKDYGVPQHRERVIFIAVRKTHGRQPSMPTPTHGIENDFFTNRMPYRTFADACSDLQFLESGQKSTSDLLHDAVHHPKHVIDWLWDVPQGASAHDNVEIFMRPSSGYNTTYKRQIWNEPASTVQTTFGMISGCRNVHPIATRALTIREAARIQSFPDSFVFRGSLGSIRSSIGNAVPPLLAYSIARHIRENILNSVEIPC